MSGTLPQRDNASWPSLGSECGKVSECYKECPFVPFDLRARSTGPFLNSAIKP
jgi:hypothetical protein